MWRQAVRASTYQPHAVDDFFATWLPDVLLLVKEHPDPWLQRLMNYSNEREQQRREFRWRFAAADHTLLRRYHAMFAVWYMLTPAPELLGSDGRWWASWHYQLEAQLAYKTNDHARLLEKAANACWPGTGSPQSRGLTVRHIYLKTLSLRAQAFAALASNRDPFEVEENLRRSAETAAWLLDDVQLKTTESLSYVHSDASETQWPMSTVHYVNWWWWCARLFRLEIEGSADGARSCHASACDHIEGARTILERRRRYGEWHDHEDFMREVILIRVIEELRRGRSGLHDALRLMNDWVKASRATMSATVRFHRAEIRRACLRALNAKEGGLSAGDSQREIRRLISRWPGVGMTTKSLSALVLRVLRNETTFDVALPEILKLFPLHARQPIAPDVRDDTRPRAEHHWHNLPFWLPEGKSQAQHHNNPVLARAVLDSYFRIIADFTWQVYIDTLKDEGYSPIPDCPSDLRLVSTSELSDALAGLERANRWAGPSGLAFRHIVEIAKMAVDANDFEVADRILDDVVEVTERHLFPVPIQALEVAADGSFRARRFDHIREELNVEPGTFRPVDGEFLYLKPRYKAHVGNITQHARASRQGKKLHLYKARAFGRPSTAYLLCEGETDQAILELVLDDLDPAWSAYLRIESCGGDIPSFVRTRSPENCVVLADADMAPGPQAAKRWVNMWSRVRWGQIIDPDIERADCAAYAAALEHLWRQSVSLSEIAEMGRVSVTGAEFEARIKKRYRPLPVKGFEVGRHLGEQFLIRGVPEPLVQVTHAALLLSRGFEPEPFSPRVSSELVNLGLTSA